jgi:hypothetical protein
MPTAVPDGRVRLKWRVSTRGYHIVRRDMRAPDAPNSLVAKAEKVSLGYQGLADRDYLDFIVSLGRETTEYEAGLLEHAIFRDLVNSAQQPGPEGVLGFVRRWGQLNYDWRRPQPLETFIRVRNTIVRALDHHWRDMPPGLGELFTWPGLPADDLGGLGVRIEVKRGRLEPYFQTQSLLQFCVLELLHAHAGRIDFMRCEACGLLLPLPKAGRPNLYCSNKCKQRAWRAKHPREPRRAEGQKRTRRRRG